MAVVIRFARYGAKGKPFYRIVAADKEFPRDGRYLETLGTYNPKAGEKNLKADRILYWIKEGAKCSDTMHNFLVHDKIIQGKKVNVLPKKKPTLKRKELKAKK